MFVVVYGLTGEIGAYVRSFFDSQGFKRLKKTYYTTSEEDAIRLRSENNDLVSSREEIITNYDYNYTINRKIIGFNKKDFDDSVHGKESMYTTFSSLDIEFLKKLKAEYGKYVTTVFSCIDDDALRSIARKYTEQGAAERIETSKYIKKTYLDNIPLFDRVVIYGGEESAFNFRSLDVQLKDIIEKAKTNEVMLNSQRKVQLPYVGTDDYIFVSYSHKDKEAVEEKLHILQRNGFRLWYDSGLRGGEDWKMVLREKIKSCTDFLLFSSENSVHSEDVKIEIITAEIYEKKIVNVKLDDWSRFDGTIENILHNLHAIDGREAFFENKIITALSESAREPVEEL